MTQADSDRLKAERKAFADWYMKIYDDSETKTTESLAAFVAQQLKEEKSKNG